MNRGINKSIRIVAAGLLLLSIAADRAVAAASPTDNNGNVYVSIEQAVKRMPAGTSLGASVLMIVDPETVIRVDTNQGGWSAGSGPPGHGGGSFFNPAFAPPPDADSLPPIDALALKYSRNLSVYGHIGALVPRVMTVLNVPDNVDRSSLGTPIEDAERLFLASLDDDRWRALLGDGLAISDLTDDQRALFAGMLARPIDVAPTTVALPHGSGDEWTQSDQAYFVSVKHLDTDQFQGAQTIHASFAAGAGPVDYRIVTSASRTYATGPDPLAQVAVAVPNVLKDSQLSTDKMTATVKLKPRETVVDIVDAIANATDLELFCDKRYVTRNVTVLGDVDRPIEVVDLIKALRMSVCATWRKVGTAYVLTDDIAGYASRRRAIAGRARMSTDRVRHDLDKAVKILAARTSVAGDKPVALGGHDDAGLMLHFSLDIPDVGKVGLDDISCATEEAPAVITNATFGETGGHGVMPPSIDEPATAPEAKSTVDADFGSGNRSVYLKVFHDGKAYFDSKALPSADTAGVLQSAFDESRAKGVKLYAIVDLLQWSRTSDASTAKNWTPIAAEDTTVDGRTACQALADAVASGTIEPGSPFVDAAGGDWVSPADPRVKEILTGIARELGSTNGLSGIVLADTTPPGYEGTKSPLRPVGVDLGYEQNMRLAYLREAKEDPIDLDDPADEVVALGPRVATLDVLGFGALDKVSQDVKPWIKFRQAYAKQFLAGIVAEIHKTSPAMPVYIEATPGGPIAPYAPADVESTSLTTASR